VRAATIKLSARMALIVRSFRVCLTWSFAKQAQPGF
jgi:hypothetical protein